MVDARDPSKMNPFQTRGRRPKWIPARARLRMLTVIAGLSLGTACGSSQGDAQRSGAAGTAGTAEGVSLAGGGASNAAGGHSGGSSSGVGGGSAGVPSGGGGASGGNSDARGGSAGAGGSALGAAGGGGKGGAGAGGPSGGTGGAIQAPACPTTAPVGASSCDWNGQVCFYEDCAGAGRTVATCLKLGATGFSWSLQNTACGAVHCSGLPGPMSCASGQVCSVSQSGTISGTCEQSTCGAGPITCECAHATCTNCAILGSAAQGFTVTCNNCPQGGCP